MQLALMGSWAGDDSEHSRWLLDPRSRDFELADIYCFVRRDISPHVFERCAQNIRGDHVEPSLCLMPARPVSTLTHAVSYALTCLRDRMHLRGAAQALMLLNWLEDVALRIEHLSADPILADDIAATRRRLRRFERVQHMEKARFWKVHDSLPEGALKERLRALWCRTWGEA
jgi:hypothetical protein